MKAAVKGLQPLFEAEPQKVLTNGTQPKENIIGHARKKAREIVRKSQSLKSTQIDMFGTFDLLPF